ncbi:MAG: F0F1 ATP synthase subunit delta [Bacteroidetes bacterium]|nr:F0F1 ATP synthase subunit delta [Rhodothermaceae bacterium RA]RMH62791.1 MAG: F0F1 ATP synthase subunit delta [Bacteroidota bacterium]
MSDTIVARRYAQALYEQAREARQVEQIDEDVELIRQALADSRELVRLFESPVIPREKKQAVVNQLFGPRVQPLTLRFLTLLIEKEREGLFAAIVQAYRRLRDEQQGIVEAQARVAQPLAEDEEKKLREALEAITGKRIRLRTEQDPSLLGGVVIRVGDTVYDGSVRHQLRTLREKLEQGAFVTN